MTEEEQIVLQAACVQAAATMRGAANPQGSIAALNVEECAKLARQLFEEIAGTAWPAPVKASARAPTEAATAVRGS